MSARALHVDGTAAQQSAGGQGLGDRVPYGVRTALDVCRRARFRHVHRRTPTRRRRREPVLAQSKRKREQHLWPTWTRSMSMLRCEDLTGSIVIVTFES